MTKGYEMTIDLVIVRRNAHYHAVVMAYCIVATRHVIRVVDVLTSFVMMATRLMVMVVHRSVYMRISLLVALVPVLVVSSAPFR